MYQHIIVGLLPSTAVCFTFETQSAVHNIRHTVKTWTGNVKLIITIVLIRVLDSLFQKQQFYSYEFWHLQLKGLCPCGHVDVTTSYNSVDRAAWLGKVTSQRHACRTGNKMAAWTVATATEKKQRFHVNFFSGTVVNWTCCVFFTLTCS
jgi:hypothetical protein